MADIIGKIKKTLEESLDIARTNAQSFKETAEEYSKTARLKLDLLQLKNNRKKKIALLGETVYPYLLANDFSGLQEHETLRVLIDDIKIVQNEIELAEKALKELAVKETNPAIGREEIQRQIQELEQQIESRMDELKAVKKALDENAKPNSH